MKSSKWQNKFLRVLRALRIRDVILAILCFVGLITVFQNATSYLAYILNIFSGWPGRLFLTANALFVAFLLFYIREHNRSLYALMELTFALISMWYAVSTITKDPKQWPVVIGAMYLFVRGLDNLLEGYKRRLIEWRRKGMNGSPEDRDKFLKEVFHGVRFNGRIGILSASKAGKTQQEMFDQLLSSNLNFAAKQANETGYDIQQSELYVATHRKAYESLAEEFGLNSESIRAGE
jgi:hypothetical protein